MRARAWEPESRIWLEERMKISGIQWRDVIEGKMEVYVDQWINGYYFDREFVV